MPNHYRFPWYPEGKYCLFTVAYKVTGGHSVINRRPSPCITWIGCAGPTYLGHADFVNIRDAMSYGQDHHANGLPRAVVSPPTARSLAYVMLTSGTTGQPKGVMIEHRGIMRLIMPKKKKKRPRDHYSQVFVWLTYRIWPLMPRP